MAISILGKDIKTRTIDFVSDEVEMSRKLSELRGPEFATELGTYAQQELSIASPGISSQTILYRDPAENRFVTQRGVGVNSSVEPVMRVVFDSIFD